MSTIRFLRALDNSKQDVTTYCEVPALILHLSILLYWTAENTAKGTNLPCPLHVRELKSFQLPCSSTLAPALHTTGAVVLSKASISRVLLTLHLKNASSIKHSINLGLSKVKQWNEKDGYYRPSIGRIIIIVYYARRQQNTTQQHKNTHNYTKYMAYINLYVLFIKLMKRNVFIQLLGLLENMLFNCHAQLCQVG